MRRRTYRYDIWARDRGVYGRRKLWKAALREGWSIGRDQVGRLMKILGIQKDAMASGDIPAVKNSTALSFTPSG
jgi:ISMsm1 transposase orfB